MLSAHAGFFSYFPSLGCPAVLLCKCRFKLSGDWPTVLLCYIPQIVLIATGMVDVQLLTIVHVSSSCNRCLIVSHHICRVVTSNRKKLRVVERCPSNYCVINSVNVFRLEQERKYACGEYSKFRILQHSQTLGPNIRVYKLRFINRHAQQKSMAFGVQAAVGPLQTRRGTEWALENTAEHPSCMLGV